MPVNEQLVKNIRAKMKKAGIGDNVSELACRAGVRKATVWDILNRQNENVRLSTLQKIARALKTSVSELLKGV